METLCGQAFGAGKLRMLGVYMQRSWIILLCAALLLVPIYVFSPPILKLIGETSEISDLAGKSLLSHTPICVNIPDRARPSLRYDSVKSVRNHIPQ